MSAGAVKFLHDPLVCSLQEAVAGRSYGSLTSVILQITSTPVLVEKNYIQEFLACVIDVKLKHEDRTLKRSN